MKIIKPVIGGHDGSCFRELYDIWEEKGYCEVIAGSSQRDHSYSCDIDSPQSKCWINDIGDILLYDMPLLDRLKHDYNFGLFANECPNDSKSKNWTFIPKWPRLYDTKKNSLRRNLTERTIKVGFVGAPTNPTRNKLAQDWHSFCDLFHFHSSQIQHPEYLNLLSHMKYGLCLRGVGRKCLRDIELIGMGTVPIFTEGVSTEYYEKLEENIHFISANSPEEALEKISTISDEQWKTLSSNCIEWFERNCSVDGVYQTTMKLLEGRSF